MGRLAKQRDSAANRRSRQRLAALLAFEAKLDDCYAKVGRECFTAEDLGVA